MHEKVARTIYFQNPNPAAVPERPPGSVRRLAGSSSYVLELVFPRGLSTFRCLMITIFRILLDLTSLVHMFPALQVQCKYA